MRMKQLAYAIGLIGVATITTARADDQDQQAQPQKVEKIEVTGSSIKRLAKEGALPVTTITHEEIQRSAASSTEQLVQMISAATTAGAASTAAAAGSSSYSVASISLRGLGDNRTLVLVNGRRLASFSAAGAGGGAGGQVDINAIPLSAIERVEVLKDGASSVYGSDAVAGVVNFILRKDYKGFETTAYYGSPTQSGGGDIERVSFVAGWGNLDQDRFNVMFTGDIDHEGELLGKDRSFTQQGTGFNAWGSHTSANTAPAAVFTTGGGSPAYSYPNCPGFGMVADPIKHACQFDATPYVGLIPKLDRGDLLGSVRFNLNENTQLYAEGMYAQNKHTFSAQPSPMNTGFLSGDTVVINYLGQPTQVQNAGVTIQPNNPYYPTAWAAANGVAGQPLDLGLRLTDTGPRIQRDTGTQSRFLIGAKGSLGKWDYDVAATTNRQTDKSEYLGGWPLMSKILPIIDGLQAASDGSYFNPFSINQTAAIHQLLQSTNFNGTYLNSSSTASSVDGKISGEVWELPAGPLSTAVGFDARHEHLTISPSAEFLSGDIGGNGGSTGGTDRGRDVRSFFAEANVPILKDMPFAKSLEADVAVRSDHYSDLLSGNTTVNPKLSFRWQPIRQLLVRASGGSGFRAPTLAELYSPVTPGSGPAIVDPQCRAAGYPDAICNTQWVIHNGGNTQLRPEKSKQYSMGFVVEPRTGTSMSMDFFWVHLKNAITNGIDESIALNNPTYSYLVHRNAPTTAQPWGGINYIDQGFVNANKIDVAGIDLDIASNLGKFSFGKVRVELNGTYMQRYDLTNPDGSVTPSISTYQTAAVVSGTGYIPRWKHVLSIDVDNGPWAVTLMQNYQDSYQDAPVTSGPNAGTNHGVGSLTTYDTQLGYSGIKNLKLALGVKNLLDTKPPMIIPSGNTFQSTYDPTYYDPRGRFVYMSGTYKWW